MRKNDEYYPHPERGLGEKGSQRKTAFIWLRRKLQKLVDRFKHNDFKYLSLKSDLATQLFELRCFSEIFKIILETGVYDVSNLDRVLETTETPQSTKVLSEKPNMSGIAPVLPSTEELDRVDEVEQRLERYPHLERCYFASDSLIAGLYEFFLEIAKLEGDEPEAGVDKGFLATKRVIKAFKILKRMEPRARKLLKWASFLLDGWDNESAEELIRRNKAVDRFRRLSLKIYKKITEAYELMICVVDDSWNYLPIELQEALESLSRRVFLALPSFDEALSETSETSEGLFKRLLECKELVTNLSFSVFSAIESTTSVPKLYFLQLVPEQGLSSADSREKLDKSFALSEIQELTENLCNLSGVDSVIAVTHTPGDMHRVTFNLQLAEDDVINVSFDTLEDLFEIAERIAFRVASRLRDLTSEKWYFHVELVDGSNDYPNSNRIIATFNARPSNPPPAS